MYFYKIQYSYMKMILGIENHNSNIIYGHAPQYYELFYIYIYISHLHILNCKILDKTIIECI